jgi:hypothetical protein
VAQKKGTKILQVSNHANPLRASNRVKSVKKAVFVLLQLLALEARNHGLKNLQSLDFVKPETCYPQIYILYATGLQDK